MSELSEVFLNKRRELIIKMLEDGKSIKEIEDKCELGYTSICNIATSAGYMIYHDYWVGKKANEIINNPNLSIVDKVMMTGYKKSEIAGYIQKSRHLTKEEMKQLHKDYKKDLIDKAVQLAKEGFCKSDICDELCVKYYYLQNSEKELGRQGEIKKAYMNRASFEIKKRWDWVVFCQPKNYETFKRLSNLAMAGMIPCWIEDYKLIGKSRDDILKICAENAKSCSKEEIKKASTPYFVNCLLKYGNTVISKKTAKEVMLRNRNSGTLFEAIAHESDGRIRAAQLHGKKTLEKEAYTNECLIVEMY